VDLHSLTLGQQEKEGVNCRMVIPVSIQVNDEWVTRDCLVDSGASMGFISQLLVKELDLDLSGSQVRTV
jgi:hypothetical protein